MKNTLVVVADLGCLKAYRLEKTPVQQTPRLELLEQFNNDAVSRATSDASGRFSRGGARLAPGMSDGERHNSQLENRKRLVRQLAGQLNQLLKREDASDCYLAVSREIHNHLLAELDPAMRTMIVRSVQADLTRVDKGQLLTHF